ncbi:MAG: hypothetical protein ACI8YD_002055, partial [Rheinheimera aquimaris]
SSVDGSEVLQAIAILEKRAQAELISLPIQLSAEAAPSARKENTP